MVSNKKKYIISKTGCYFRNKISYWFTEKDLVFDFVFDTGKVFDLNFDFDIVYTNPYLWWELLFVISHGKRTWLTAIP